MGCVILLILKTQSLLSHSFLPFLSHPLFLMGRYSLLARHYNAKREILSVHPWWGLF